MIFRFGFGPPFGSHFGGVLGAQMEANAIKKPPQKNINNNDAQYEPKLVPKGLPNWSHNDKMKSWKHLASRVAPKWPPEPLQDRFWKGFGTILGPFSSVVLTFVCWFVHAFFSSMLQTKTFNITRSHQNNAAESFQETAYLVVPSCIEKFTSER